VNKPDPPNPTLKEFREILINDHDCFVDPPPANSYSTRQLNFINRKIKDGTIYQCPPFPMNDDEIVSKELALWVCRQLHIYPAKIPFLSHIAIL